MFISRVSKCSVIVVFEYAFVVRKIYIEIRSEGLGELHKRVELSRDFPNDRAKKC